MNECDVFIVCTVHVWLNVLVLPLLLLKPSLLFSSSYFSLIFDVCAHGIYNNVKVIYHIFAYSQLFVYTLVQFFLLCHVHSIFILRFFVISFAHIIFLMFQTICDLKKCLSTQGFLKIWRKN